MKADFAFAVGVSTERGELWLDDWMDDIENDVVPFPLRERMGQQ